MRLRTGLVATVAAALVLSSCGSAEVLSTGTSAAGSGWSVVAPSPLSARHDGAVVWVGDRFLVVGGADDPPCPPNASCAAPTGWLIDGAAYDPVSDEWARIADAPTPVLFPSTAVVGDVLYVLSELGLVNAPPAFLAYDVSDDSWTTLPLPPDGNRRLVAVGDVLFSVQGSDEHEPAVDSWFDPATATWHPLPDDPLGPSYDRALVEVDGRVVLTAKDLAPDPGGSAGPSLVRLAELDPAMATWTVLPTSEVIGSDPVSVGGRLVFPDVGGADGGEVGNWGRVYPFGGIYDPATATWDALPELTGTSSWPRVVVGDLVRVGDSLLDPVTLATTPIPEEPWGLDDSPSLAGSPAAVLAWGGLQDQTATGWIFVP